MRFVPKRLKAKTASPRRKVLEKILRAEEKLLLSQYQGVLTR